MTIACIDLETTGLDPAKDRIIEIACAKFDEETGKITDTFSSLVNPEMPISDTIKMITGITDEMLLKAPSIRKILPEFIEFIGKTPMLGHNVSFDIGFLEKAGIPAPKTAYDTYELMRVLVPTASSYALDVVASQWGIRFEPAHRALSDVKSTVELWNILIKEIRSLPQETLRQLDILFKKSAWPYKKFFSSKTPKKLPAHGFSIPTQEKKQFQTLQEREKLPENIFKKWFKGNKILYATDKLFSHQSEGALKIAIITPFDESPSLHPPEHYLSKDALELLLAEKPDFTHEETSFLTRIILWKEKTQTGLRHELSLRGEDWSLWSIISGGGNFWEKAKTKADKSRIVFLPSSSFVSEPLRKFCESRYIMCEEALHLEDRITAVASEAYALFHFETYFKIAKETASNEDIQPIADKKNSLELLYGFLGMYFQKNTDPVYQSDVILNRYFFQSAEGKRVKEAALSYEKQLESCNQTLSQEKSKLYRLTASSLIGKLKRVLGLLLSPAENTAVWISMYRETVTLHAGPVDIAPLTKEVFEKSAGILVADPALEINGEYSFIKNIFGINEGWETEKNSELSLSKMRIEIPAGMPEPNANGYFQKSAEIMEETVREYRGGILIICQAQRAVEAHYKKLLAVASAQKLNILATKITGGQGKVVSLFMQNPEQSILIGNQALARDIEALAPSLRCIIFQKLPFDFSFSPLQKLRPQKYKNGYAEYTFPRGILRFKHFLYRWQGYPGEKKLILLDPRTKGLTL